MKDNTLRESLNDILAKAVVGEHYILVNANGTKTVNLARKRIEALLAEEVRKARIDELKRNAYYSQPRKTDPLRLCGIDMTEEQVNDRITELEKEGK